MRFLRNRWAAIGFGAFLVAGCEGGSGSAVPDAKTGPRAREELLQSYQPPADQRLTPKQVELYLAVLEKLRAGPPPAAPAGVRLSEAIEAGAPDLGIARSLKANVEEYLWVKEKILEAEAATLTARLNADALASVDGTVASLRRKRETAADDASRKLVEEQTALFEAEAERIRRESKEREPEWIRANQRTLEPFRARLATLAPDLRRDRVPGADPAPSRKPS